MKWYSVKDHQPILSCCCILLAIYMQKRGEIYLTLGEWDNGWKDWEHKFDIEKELVGHKVLYFCYPDPIPKAYESLMESNKTINPDDSNSVKDTLIKDIGFTVRTTNCLIAGGIETLDQLLVLCAHQFLYIPNLGKKSIKEITDWLNLSGIEHGWRLK
jgi:DNA-directed RNA polymerase alpha subunit